MDEIISGLRQIGASLPLNSVVRYRQNHLDCQMEQRGDEIYLFQFDGTRAVGHWRWDAADIEAAMSAGEET